MGACTTSTASTLGSAVTICSASTKRSGVALPPKSTGFSPGLLISTWLLCSAAWVSGLNSASLPPALISLSMASMAGPSPLETIAKRSPCSGFMRDSVSSASSISSESFTRTTPARAKAASNTTSRLAIPGVGGMLEISDCGVRPLLIATTKRLREASRTEVIKCWASVTRSRCNKMA